MKPCGAVVDEFGRAEQDGCEFRPTFPRRGKVEQVEGKSEKARVRPCWSRVSQLWTNPGAAAKPRYEKNDFTSTGEREVAERR